MQKTVGTRSPLSNTIKDTSTIMRNPSLHMQARDMDDCASTCTRMHVASCVYPSKIC